MPGHAGTTHITHQISNVKSLFPSDKDAHLPYMCPHCGRDVVAAVIAFVHEAHYPVVAWTRCPGCHKGVVFNDGVAAPRGIAGENVDGLPTEVEAAYREARETAGIAAFTSCELMCRKILMHIAVDKGAEEGKTFIQYLDHLTTTGYITPPMRPWLDLIRTHGNSSTHRLQSASKERALNTLAFTTQLLRLVYEMDHRAQAHIPPVDQ
ncbi:DUF4145 domain-containing protein [Micromonospora chersina]|uniref:DUF4145 domain-containing protein n=1 Tax=Micromonospora chersina TaxID=47854 RepID=UPI0033C4B64C